MKGMTVLLSPGLITFSVLGPFPHLFQMCILCVQIAYYQIITTVFFFKANCPSIPITSFTYSKPLRTNWSKLSHSDIEKYNAMVSLRISSLPPEVFNCSLPHCTIRQDVLES